ncbi:MAG: phospholipase D-like domain-containing protein [Candidatus Rhabdochlamydia sp.]
MSSIQNISASHDLNKPVLKKEADKKASTAYKTYKFVLKALGITAILGLVLSIKIIPTGSFASLSASAPCIYTKQLFSSSASAIISLIRGRKTIFPGLSKELMQIIRQPIAQNQFSKCSSIVCQNTIESFAWKKELIQAAEHNIVLSGNYCGGKAFDEILSMIELQLEKKPLLKVVILSSDKFIDESNRKKITSLTSVYSDRFQLVESPDIWTIGEKAKFSTNHSKILSIDYGKYFILGGSGLEDKYAYHDGLGNQQKSTASKNTGLLERILPRSFRDQDFVFCDEKSYEGTGGRVHLETLQLAYAWMHYNKSQEKDSVAEKILLDQSIDRSQPIVNTSIDSFHQNAPIPDVETKILFTGPENTNNAFAQELIRLFNQAKKHIVIAHMYFHPSQEVFDALVNAANRGVAITLTTNGYDENSPMSHKVFGPRNRFNYIALKNAVHKNHQKNIKIHEFKRDKTTYHKKVIVIDNIVIAGSSNIGSKSLYSNSDHEINFIAKNATFAEQTLETIQVDCDKQHARLISISMLKNFTIPEFTRTASHSLMGFLIG